LETFRSPKRASVERPTPLLFPEFGDLQVSKAGVGRKTGTLVVCAVPEARDTFQPKKKPRYLAVPGLE
jgi:hypothetical protein